MQHKKRLVCLFLLPSLCLFVSQVSHASINKNINARSAILLEMQSGRILFEQNADELIAPASITKVLTLYLVFEAIKQGHVRLSDKVEVSRRAASTGGSRMGLKAGTFVSMDELIKGVAVVSGNDACVAVAEHISGSVDRFVKKMNAKARELGMTRSRFMTPNGLPAEGQVTTARDIAKLSVAYIRRFPDSLAIHSMQSYSYGKHSHHNANRLLGKCDGVDGLKTGFVCASGYNISATAKRNHVRIVAVVMGAKNPWIRCAEAERLLEAGFRETGAPYNEVIRSASVAKTSGGKKVSAGGDRWRRSARADKTGKKVSSRKTAPGKGKNFSRYASARNKPEARAEKKSHGVKSSASEAKSGRKHAKSDKTVKEQAKKRTGGRNGNHRSG